MFSILLPDSKKFSYIIKIFRKIFSCFSVQRLVLVVRSNLKWWILFVYEPFLPASFALAPKNQNHEFTFQLNVQKTHWRARSNLKIHVYGQVANWKVFVFGITVSIHVSLPFNLGVWWVELEQPEAQCLVWQGYCTDHPLNRASYVHLLQIWRQQSSSRLPRCLYRYESGIQLLFPACSMFAVQSKVQITAITQLIIN